MIEFPSFGGFLRYLRTERALPNERITVGRLSSEINVSKSYIRKMEANEAGQPGDAVISAIKSYFKLSSAEARHLKDLSRAAPPSRLDGGSIKDYELPPPEIMEKFNPISAAWLDEGWNVLQANRSYAERFPGLMEAGNVLVWFFSDDRSRVVMVDWELEAKLTVGWTRALLGRYNDASWARALFAQLEQYPEFVSLWSDHDVFFDRPQANMRVRDQSGTETSLYVEVLAKHVGGMEACQLYLGLPAAASG